MNKILEKRIIFHPVTVLFVSAIASAIFVFLINLFFAGDIRSFLLFYYAPIAIPFVAFQFDRLERRESLSIASWRIDAIVLALSLIRSVIPVPWISGHALFLSYSLLTSRSITARITAALILLQVAYIKIFVWEDPTLIGGVLAGCLAAWMCGKFNLSGSVLTEA